MSSEENGETTPERQPASAAQPDRLEEDLPAPPGGLEKFPQQRPPPHRDTVRARLAGAVLLLLALLVGVACFGWLSGWRDGDDIETFGLIMAPVVTLSGTILGFYFSTRPND